MKKFTIAGIQVAYGDDREKVIDKCVCLLKQAKEEYGAQLALFPESIDTGFNPGMPAQEFYGILDTLPGKYSEKIQEACRSNSIHALWPVYEKGPDGIIYNSAALFNDKGEMVAKYRKTHPFPTERIRGEQGWTTPGSQAVVCELPFAKVGLIICYDGDFPELSRVLALKGAEIILRPSALMRSYEIWELTNRARAYDNHVYVAAVNALGSDKGGSMCFGHSMIVNPIGQVIALARCSEEIVYAELSPEPLKAISYGIKSPQIFDHIEDRNVKSYEGIMTEGKSAFEPAMRIPYKK